MFYKNDYQLLDFGQGRRLERFGEIVLDRPCPAAEKSTKNNPSTWNDADAVFKDSGETEGQWRCHRELPDRWTIAHESLRFELKCTPFGHIGLFPEQAENWYWIMAKGEGQGAREEGRGRTSGIRGQDHLKEKIKVLNLFAYTGGSTLAAAIAGMEVMHVDAAKNIVDWARRNAELSGLSDAPIHWITEDAMKFVKREVKRGNHYDAVILDPPSYGHGRRGEVWRLSNHLPELLDLCAELTAKRCRFLLLTCHTPGYDSARLANIMINAFPNMPKDRFEAKPLTIRSAAGRDLPNGAVVRWSGNC
jgi:23S rRNA (cytosine1962-C5)-methyltransferase